MKKEPPACNRSAQEKLAVVQGAEAAAKATDPATHGVLALCRPTENYCVIADDAEIFYPDEEERTNQMLFGDYGELAKRQNPTRKRNYQEMARGEFCFFQKRSPVGLGRSKDRRKRASLL